MSVFEGTVSPPDGVLADKANIYKRGSIDEPWTFVREVDVAEAFTIDLTEEGPQEFAAAFIVNGREQPEDLWPMNQVQSTSTSELDAIGTPANFAVRQEGPDLLCRWDAVDHPFIDSYEISMGSTAAKRIVLHKAPKDATDARFSWWGTGTISVHIVAISSQGQRSPAQTVGVTIADEDMNPAQGSVDEHTAGFTSTKSGVEVDLSGDLILETLPAGNAISTAGNALDWPMWGTHKDSGTYTTAWVDVGSVVTEKIEVAATFDVDKDEPLGTDLLPPLAPRWSAGVALRPGYPSLWRHVNGTFDLVTALGVLIEIDTAQDGVPTSDGWRVWVPGTRYLYRQVRLRITLSCEWTFISPKITSFTWRRCRRNLKDEGEVTISSTGGTAASFAESFTVAPKVTAMVVGANGWVAQANNISTTGCDLRAYNAAGTEQSTATVHWQAMGV